MSLRFYTNGIMATAVAGRVRTDVEPGISTCNSGDGINLSIMKLQSACSKYHCSCERDRILFKMLVSRF
jgi:hypothetical protein